MKNRVLLISLAVVLALSVALIGCGGEEAPEVTEYNLTISSTEGGEVTTPGEGTRTYEEGMVVNLVADPEEGYRFVNWTGDVGTIADVEDATTTITMNDGYSIIANFVKQQYSLTTSSTEGGSVTTPGEGTFAYDAGTVVDLAVQSAEGYRFTRWTGDVDFVADIDAASTDVIMDGHYYITANFEELDPGTPFAGGSGTAGDPYQIANWFHLHNVRDYLDDHFILVNALGSTTAGYAELASPAANQGEGWQPIGSLYPGPVHWVIIESINPFTGSFNGQGYEIRDIFIDRPDEGCVGLFGWLGSGGMIQDVGLVNVAMTGSWDVGGLVGMIDYGVVSNSYSTGSVTGVHGVGGLVGMIDYGTVSNSYSTSSVTGYRDVGGLVGTNEQGTISDSYSVGGVAGYQAVGGLVGFHGWGTISNSHYDYNKILINGENVITIGALFNEDFEQWLANDKSWDVNERLSQEGGYYVIDDVSDFKQLLAFGQDGSLRFKLKDNLDLGTNPNFYIPYLAGEFDGNGHRIWNLSFGYDFVSQVGLFGYLAFGGEVSEVGVESVKITGYAYVGGLVGESGGTVSDSYSTGNMTGTEWVGGLVGWNNGIVSNSYSVGSVTGQSGVGGLAGKTTGITSNSYYNYDEVLINGENIISIGALVGEDFEQWLANDKFLDVNERLSQEDGYFVINDISDFKQLLAFGQDDSLRFRLKDDLDLSTEPNFYIPYLAAEFDGNGRKISNLSFSFDFASDVGLFGVLAHSGKVTQVGVANVNIVSSGSYVGGLVGDNRGGTVTNCYSGGSVTACGCVGGLLGFNIGTVSNCYFTGSVTADWAVGGLIGQNEGTVSNSYFTGSVTADWAVGGLIGQNEGTVSNSYSTGSVTGNEHVGGLVGHNTDTVSNCFWDTQTSGQSTSAGGTGKATAEMKNIATFSGVGWNIITVANPGTRNPVYTWNIVDGQTYPFLNWQSVS